MKKLQVYIAGGSAHHARIADYARQLDESGLVQFTMRWWEGAAAWTGRDRYLELDEQRAASDECMESLAMAQLVWCQYDRLSAGSHYELGAAFERKRILGTPFVVLTGPGTGSSIFHSRADFRDITNQAGLDAVLRFAKSRMQEVA